MLEGPGICHHFFQGNFSNIPACIYQFGWQHKPASTKAWWCGRSLEVGLLHSQFSHLLWKLEGGLHLPGKLSVIFHSWYCQQLGPPVWGFTLLSLPWYPLTKLQDCGLWRHHIAFISRGLQCNPLRNDATSGLSSGGSSRSEPLPVAPSSPDPVFGSVGWLGAGGSPNCTWQHLLFCSSLLCPQQSLLFDLTLVSGQFQVQLNLSISSLRVAAMASAFWWAS